MDLQQMTLLLIQLVALLFPFLGIVLQMTIGQLRDVDETQHWLPVRDIVLVGGGFSVIFLTGATILLVNVVIRTTQYGIATPFGLALTFLLASLVIFGLVSVSGTCNANGDYVTVYGTYPVAVQRENPMRPSTVLPT